MKKWIAVLLVLTFALSLSACGCEHTWADANCVDPMTCTQCGETEGVANGHVWMAATCETPKTCEVCAVTDGEPKGHAMVAATCEEAAHCENCTLVEGEALGHSWLAATTETPKTCQTCAITEGERIVTDARFTTAATIDLQGQWALGLGLSGELMGLEDFDGELPVNLLLNFANDGTMSFSVGTGDQFMEVMSQYTIDSIYAEFALEGMDKETTDAEFEAYYGMTIQEYVDTELAAVDFEELFAYIFEVADLGGVYYVQDGQIYSGYSWDSEMEGSAYTLEGDVLTIDAINEELGVEGAWQRVITE